TFTGVCILSTLQSTLTLWSLRGLSLPMYVVFKRCLPLATLSMTVCLLNNGLPSVGVTTAVLITTTGAALAGAGDLTGDPFGYVTGILAVIIHASFLVLIQKTGADSEYGPLTAQYAVAIMATPVLLLVSFVSMDAVKMWTYAGWQNPTITGIFSLCIVMGCAMNFTTLHCTYINSAVTTSFVGVVKSIVTITVGMFAFNDVVPTQLFVAGVVVNTVGSITYCIVKYVEAKKKSMYEDMDESGLDDSLPGKPPVNSAVPGDADGDGVVSKFGQPESKGLVGGDEEMLQANGALWTGDGDVELGGEGGEGGVNLPVMTEQDAVEMQREHLQRGSTSSSQSLSDRYTGVWRSVRHLQFTKKEPLLENMQQQSP
ncbi:solute carrier family 35 member D3-like, partial [Diretmus argenteus]